MRHDPVSDGALQMGCGAKSPRRIAYAEHDQVDIPILRGLQNSCGRIAVLDKRFGAAPELRIGWDKLVEFMHCVCHGHAGRCEFVMVFSLMNDVQQKQARLIFLCE